MKIVDFKVTKIAIPLRETLRMGIDRDMHETQAAIIELSTDEGIVGIAESPFDPGRSEFEMERLRPRIIGADPFDVEKLTGFDLHIGELYKTVGAVEIACYDIMGKKLGVPVYKLLGGRVWDKAKIAAFLSYDEPEIVASKALDAVSKGYTTVKLKVGLDRYKDIEIVKQVRRIVGSDVIIRVDPNQAWSVPTAISILRKIEDYDIQYVEQPIPRWDHDGLRKLSKKTSVPICICEGLTSFPELMRLIKANAIDFLSSDPIRACGLLGFKKLCGIAEAEGIPVVAHVSTFGVSVATWLHAVISNHATMYAHDIEYPGLEVGAWAPVDDIISGTPKLVPGGIDVSESPGLGVELNYSKVRKWSEYYDDIQKSSTSERLKIRYAKPDQDTTYFMPPRY
jgi:L-alanine-DL-glutamate epimerase-like enolase superfamily enzyme